LLVCSVSVSWTAFLRIALFSGSVFAAYIVSYPAIEADSPSLLIALAVAKAGGNGVSQAELCARFDDANLIYPRLNDLLTDKMAVLEGGKYKITAKGVLLSRIFAAYRDILGAGKGG